jgi:Major Facilitator Superfamily
VSVVVAAADIAFKAASGAYLKALVRPEHLLVANARFESTTWTATVLGPPLGGAAIGLLGPVTTVLADAVSYLLSAAGIRAIGGPEPHPTRAGGSQRRVTDLLDGWRYILAHPALRPLFFNTILVNGLIMATSPLLAVLMLGRLGFVPWQYGLAFAAPCVGGLVGSRLSRRLVARFGQRVQPGVGHLPARPDRRRPGRPYPVCLVDHQQGHHRGADRAVGPAGQRHRPPNRDRGRRPAPPGHPAAAPPGATTLRSR